MFAIVPTSDPEPVLSAESYRNSSRQYENDPGKSEVLTSQNIPPASPFLTT
jgi:hypothetical protein